MGIIASTVSDDSWTEADAESCVVGYSDSSILWSSGALPSSGERRRERLDRVAHEVLYRCYKTNGIVT